MAGGYILGIDQSTQGTKLLLLDETGRSVCRLDRSHAQHIDERGWVEHDPEEIWSNLLLLMRKLLAEHPAEVGAIRAVGISNQRETAMAWDRRTGIPVYPAIVWQCARGAAICQGLETKGFSGKIQGLTGLPLSPYFSGAKLAWILQQVEEAHRLMSEASLCMGTMDSWLVYKLTGGQVFRTDYSNASRTQLFDIDRLQWSPEVCHAFGIDPTVLPEVTDSDGFYGDTDFDGLLGQKIPIRAVLGDSHAALFGQGCHQPGMTKATYGTGSSVMMNIGDRPVWSQHGLATSLAWCLGGHPSYVLEGNINYTGAAITWLKEDLKLIRSAEETEVLARQAGSSDRSYFVPAFSGLGAPYWESEATGLFTGITRVTGKAEMVRAVLDAIAYQIYDVAAIMQQESGHTLSALRVDGGPTRNKYLMQFQTDILDCPVEVPSSEELSAMGVAYAAGIVSGFYDKDRIFAQVQRTRFVRQMADERRNTLLAGWKQAVRQVLWAVNEDSTG